MNPSNQPPRNVPGPGPQGQAQAQGQPATQQYIRPEMIRNLPHLDAAQKVTYEKGIRNFYAIIKANPPSSAEHQKAMTRLGEVTASIRGSLAKWKQQQQQQQQQPAQQQTQGGSQQQPQQQQQPATQAPTQASAAPQGAPATQTAPAGQEGSKGTAGQGGSNAAQPRTAAAGQAGQAGQAGKNAAQAGAQQGQPAINAEILAHLQAFPFTAPPNLVTGSPEAEKWIADARNRYGNVLRQMEQSKGKLLLLKNGLLARQQAGKPLTAEEQTEYNNRKAAYGKAHADQQRYVEGFRTQQAEYKAAAEAGKAGQAPSTTGAGAAAAPGATANGGANRAQAGQPGATGPVPAAAAGAAARGQGPSAMTQGGVTEAGGQTGSAAQPSPQIAPSSAAATVATTTAGTVNAGGNAYPLTHEDAMARAAQSYAKSGAGTTASATPSYPHGHTQATSRETNTQKMPIPKNLNIPPPQPVAISAARPTFSGGASGSNSMMGQPAIPKMPAFVLEGEGERVLSKKKLDELVRQVTGGGEGEGQGLSAEVEEAADDFVDQVIVSACKLAKLRQSATLEIRDIQLILERNYNIRVPGYASDEIRTVRKFAPAPGWSQKMSAVQAAKISGGKAE